HVPNLSEIAQHDQPAFEKSIQYMGLAAGEPILGHPVDYVFIGSCTNSRIEDLRQVAAFVKGKQKAAGVTCWVVPGSKQVEAQAREEGIDKILEAAGFQL